MLQRFTTHPTCVFVSPLGHSDPSTGFPFACLAALGSESRRWTEGVDPRICQTFAASPAEPGELPYLFRQLSEDAELETLDRMLASLESRRDKALRCIGEYRESLARQLRESADRMIDGKGVLRLEHASGKRSTAAWPWQANGKLLRINATPARAPVPDPGLAGKGRAATPIATA